MKTAEEFLIENDCAWIDGLMFDTSVTDVVKAMRQFATQQVAKRDEEVRGLINAYWKFDETQYPMSSWHDKQDLLQFLSALSVQFEPTGAEIAQVEPTDRVDTKWCEICGENKVSEDGDWCSDCLKSKSQVEPIIKVSELKDFLFNMHKVENDKIYLTLENINQFINSKATL